MLFLLGLLLFVVGSCLILLMPMIWFREIHTSYSGSRAVTCPENNRQVAVSIDAAHATVTRLRGKEDVRIAECTRWPELAGCDQKCAAEARDTAPYRQGEVPLPRTRKIYHLPVFIAAFAAFVLGVFWHSQFLFRDQWMRLTRISQAEFRQLSWHYAPHLVCFGTALLFAYGVAWLLALSGKKGMWRGIVSAAVLWLTVAAVGLMASGWQGIPSDLLKSEIAYAFLASISIGAIVGVLSGRLVLTGESH